MRMVSGAMATLPHYSITLRVLRPLPQHLTLLPPPGLVSASYGAHSCCFTEYTGMAAQSKSPPYGLALSFQETDFFGSGASPGAPHPYRLLGQSKFGQSVNKVSRLITCQRLAEEDDRTIVEHQLT
ncbi:unnamed protein product [Protopolystoma xenopodis]|uniref:Uncharacterized protein n=1 Tax=Protopolystoma xenopodis TaxID=117903 RepID=A0A448XE98_9PLAT|nr:unnamed protein product [Protopolystoma xenopodis]